MVMETIRDNGHSDRVIKKCQRIAGLKALLKEWELSGDLDLDYIRGLKALTVKDHALVRAQDRARIVFIAGWRS